MNEVATATHHYMSKIILEVFSSCANNLSMSKNFLLSVMLYYTTLYIIIVALQDTSNSIVAIEILDVHINYCTLHVLTVCPMYLRYVPCTYCTSHVLTVCPMYLLYVPCTYCMSHVLTVRPMYLLYVPCTYCMSQVLTVCPMYLMYVQCTYCMSHVLTVCPKHLLYVPCTYCMSHVLTVRFIYLLYLPYTYSCIYWVLTRHAKVDCWLQIKTTFRTRILAPLNIFETLPLAMFITEGYLQVNKPLFKSTSAASTCY